MAPCRAPTNRVGVVSSNSAHAAANRSNCRAARSAVLSKTATKSSSVAFARKPATRASASANAARLFCRRRDRPLLHRHPLLQALTGIDLAGIKIAARVELADMHPVEFAGLAARPAEAADHGAVAAAHRFQHVVGAVDQDEKILLLVERRERQPPARAGALGGRVEHVLPDEAAVLLEHLHAVVGAVADEDQTVLGQRDAMHRGELR